MTNVARDVRMTQEEREEIRDNVERTFHNAAQREYSEQQRAAARLEKAPEGEFVTRDTVPLSQMTPLKEDVELFLKNSDRINHNLVNLDESIFFNSDSIKYEFRVFKEKDENMKNNKIKIKNPVKNHVNNFLKWESEQKGDFDAFDEEAGKLEAPCLEMNSYNKTKR